MNTGMIKPFIWISTHTLTWSVTQCRNREHCGAGDFNSHAHVERDVSAVLMGADVADFNSHAHVERDETVPDVDTICTDFNSHAHVERDRQCI